MAGRRTAVPSVDRRVARTKAQLGEALVSLMVERGWDAVSVQSLCERANVGRSTFYLHFAGKEELLASGLDQLRRRLAGERARVPGRLGFVHGLIEHAYEQKHLFRALMGRRSGQVVHDRFRRLIVQLTRDELAALGVPAGRLDGVTRYIAGAFTELLTWSIDRARSVDADELERQFHELTAPVLARARGA
jgi:AcrR family transcriptional regulator